MALSDKACQRKSNGKLQKLSDGQGLQLWLHPQGYRFWRLAYRFGGKQKLLAIGTYPAVSLAEARELRDQAKQLLRAGTDPSEVRKQAKAAGPAPETTFRAIAEEYLAKKSREGRASSTITKLGWLLGFAYPAFGDRDVRDIRPVDVLPVLKKLEARGRIESARRLREITGCVFRFAMATARAETDPTLALRGALTQYRPKQRAAIIDPKSFGALLRAIDGFDGQPTTAAALKLLALLFSRPGEMRAAEWIEFDLDAAVWTIPATRTKMRRQHKIPLPRQALAILQAMQSITGAGRFVFPSVRTVSKPLSESTLNAALRRLGYSKDEATSHGFRASASTLLNESGHWNADAIERQLAHVETNNVRRAYARGEHWDERVKMMAWWANYLDRLREGGEIVTLQSMRR